MTLKTEHFKTAMQLRAMKLPLWKLEDIMSYFKVLSFDEVLHLYPFMIDFESDEVIENMDIIPFFQRRAEQASLNDFIVSATLLYNSKKLHRPLANAFFKRSDLSLAIAEDFSWLDMDAYRSYVADTLKSYSVEQLQKVVSEKPDELSSVTSANMYYANRFPAMIAYSFLYEDESISLVDRFEAYRYGYFPNKRRDFMLCIPEASDASLWGFLGQCFSEPHFLTNLQLVPSSYNSVASYFGKYVELQAIMQEIMHRDAFSLPCLYSFLEMSMGKSYSRRYNPFLYFSNAMVRRISESEALPSYVYLLCEHALSINASVYSCRWGESPTTVDLQRRQLLDIIKKSWSDQYYDLLGLRQLVVLVENTSSLSVVDGDLQGWLHDSIKEAFLAMPEDEQIQYMYRDDIAFYWSYFKKEYRSMLRQWMYSVVE